MKKKLKLIGLVIVGGLITISSCEDDPEPDANDLDGIWIEGDWQTMTITSTDTTTVYGEYVGDGYNNGVTTVTVVGESFVTNDVISVDGLNYTITEYETDQADPMWRYTVMLEANSYCNSCKYYLRLFKRQND